MLTDTIVPNISVSRKRECGAMDRVCRNILYRALQNLECGTIEIQELSALSTFGQCKDGHGFSAALTVVDPRFFRSVVFGGSLGAGEAYMKGWWTTTDLTALIRILILNEQAFSEIEGLFTRASKGMLRAWHAWRRNTRQGSRRNIGAHYDLSNEFYELMLDETMTYSCGMFESPKSNLADASKAKLDRICRKLDLLPGDHVLEIGTGWGSFALHAAKEYGCRVTTTTISKQQYELARKRIEDAGLGDRIELLQTDYRDLSGSFDKLVSIEMIEAIGWRQYDTYFRACSKLLKPHGAACIQAITMADRHYEQAKRGVDFIKRYIFPGSCIPSIAAMSSSIARSSDLTVADLEDITSHYPLTLRAWFERFRAHLPQVRKLGFGEEFIRMWEFYLCYCEAGFSERYIGDIQMLLVKPGYRTAPAYLRL